MVAVGLLYRAILSETFFLLVIIHTHLRTVPVAVALDTEVVVALYSQVRLAIARLEQSLRQRNAGGHTAAAHFFDRKVGIFVNISLLRCVFSRRGLYRRKCREKAYKCDDECRNMFHTGKCTKFIVLFQ